MIVDRDRRTSDPIDAKLDNHIKVTFKRVKARTKGRMQTVSGKVGDDGTQQWVHELINGASAMSHRVAKHSMNMGEYRVNVKTV